jgi:hypothetical protein
MPQAASARPDRARLDVSLEGARHRLFILTAYSASPPQGFVYQLPDEVIAAQSVSLRLHEGVWDFLRRDANERELPRRDVIGQLLGRDGVERAGFQGRDLCR